MTDRELLEMAAKAMHNLGDPNFRNYTMYADRVCLELGSKPGAITGYWKPLTDDGDAFRLAVKLRLSVMHLNDASQPKPWLRVEDQKGRWTHSITDEFNADPYAATRLAIVRAAAEIGRNMHD